MKFYLFTTADGNFNFMLTTVNFSLVYHRTYSVVINRRYHGYGGDVETGLGATSRCVIYCHSNFIWSKLLGYTTYYAISLIRVSSSAVREGGVRGDLMVASF
jgi:hypothetical protein